MDTGVADHGRSAGSASYSLTKGSRAVRHPAVTVLRWQMVCLVGLVVAVPVTWLASPSAWVTALATIGWAAAIAAFFMGWRAILSERRLTPVERREILLRVSPVQLRRIEFWTPILFVATGAFAVGGILILISRGHG